MSEQTTPETGGATAATHPGQKAESPRSAAAKVRGALGELLIVVVGALVISSLLRAFVGQMFIIPSGSMQNTLDVQDRVVVSKVTDFERGDVVVFADPAHWLPDNMEPVSPVRRGLELVGVLPSSSTQHLVKRVIGTAGDKVVCCDAHGRMSVNGQPLDETDYLYVSPAGAQVQPSDFAFDVTVPQGRVFVMGDHRDASGDSRCHLGDGQPRGMTAFVPVTDVVGPVVAIAAPFNRWRTFSTPDTFAEVPAGANAPAAPSVSVTDPTC